MEEFRILIWGAEAEDTQQVFSNLASLLMERKFLGHPILINVSQYADQSFVIDVDACPGIYKHMNFILSNEEIAPLQENGKLANADVMIMCINLAKTPAVKLYKDRMFVEAKRNDLLALYLAFTEIDQIMSNREDFSMDWSISRYYSFMQLLDICFWDENSSTLPQQFHKLSFSDYPTLSQLIPGQKTMTFKDQDGGIHIRSVCDTFLTGRLSKVSFGYLEILFSLLSFIYKENKISFKPLKFYIYEQ